MNSKNVGLDSALTALAPAIWGSTYLVTTELLPPHRPLLAATIRALPAGLLLIAIGRAVPRGVWWWRSVLLGTLNIGAFFYLLFVTAYHLPGGVAALIVSVQPILVLILSALLLKERIRPVQLGACLLGVAGVAMLVLQPGAGVDTVGLLAGLGAALCMASGIVLTKRWGRPAGISVLTFTGWQLTVGGLLLAPFTLVAEGLPAHVSGVNIGALFAYAIWFRGIERLPALAVSFLGFASPVAAAVLGYVVLGQELSPLQTTGALAVVIAVVLAQPRPRRKPDNQPSGLPMQAPSQSTPAS